MEGFAATRDEALTRLEEFGRLAASYGRERNHVRPGHGAVSRLSPALRHRLVEEDEVVAAVLAVRPFGAVEKFVQEVWWRRYWKAWLSLRPQVWDDYLAALETLDAEGRWADAAARIEAGNSGNRIIDRFMDELRESGYLHNHARMWVAGWWVHQARLPWELGARCFFRHLLDGDPASNTLSWRWVAGLQTPGKVYLARRENLEKYLAPAWIEGCEDDLAAFERPEALVPQGVGRVAVTRERLEAWLPVAGLRTGVWVHEEDLRPESSALGEWAAATGVLVTGHLEAWRHWGFPEAKQGWIRRAMEDAATRVGDAWRVPVRVEWPEDLEACLVSSARERGLEQIVALRPEVGPLADREARLREGLERAGVRLAWVERPRDVAVRPLARAGFFDFWKRVDKPGWATAGSLTLKC